MPDLAVDPDLGLDLAHLALEGAAPVPPRDRRHATGAEARGAPRRPVRRRRPRRRRRLAAHREVDDAARHRHRAGPHAYPSRGAVLRARLRRWHVHRPPRPAPHRRHRHAVRTGRRHPDRGRGGRHRRLTGAVLPGQRRRHHRDLPEPPGARRSGRRVRRRVPRRRRLEHDPLRLRRAGGRAADAGPAQPHLRRPPGDQRDPVDGLPHRRSRHSRDPVRAQARRRDGLRDRPEAGGQHPDRAPGPRHHGGEVPLPRRAAPGRRRQRRRVLG